MRRPERQPDDTPQLPTPPPDATHDLGDWTLDHDGYGRPFRGTVRGAVSVQGYQHADGRVERSILLTLGGHVTELTDPRVTAHAILALADETEALR